MGAPAAMGDTLWVLLPGLPSASTTALPLVNTLLDGEGYKNT